MRASDGLRQITYAIVMIVMLLGLFFLLVGDFATAAIFVSAGMALVAGIEWARARGIGRDARTVAAKLGPAKG